jgi:hypothetical protein
LAITHADAGTLGSGGAAPGGGSTTIPVLAISGPPTARAPGLAGAGIDGEGDGRLAPAGRCVRPAVVTPDIQAGAVAATTPAAAAVATTVMSQPLRRTLTSSLRSAVNLSVSGAFPARLLRAGPPEEILHKRG